MFVPSLRATDPSPEAPLLISVNGSRVVLGEGEPEAGIFLGTLAGRHCWAVDVDGDGEPDVFLDLFSLYSSVDETTWAVAGRAVQLVEWRRTHRFCGRCATPTEEVPGERAVRCPDCRLMAFPRLAPAVIMLVERPSDGAALLARNVNFPGGMFSALAGFVEPGETLEQAVRREILEEVGVTVGALHYFGSQPWPFPHQLMIGFRAEWESGDIVCDGTEIAEAGWFTVDDLPPHPPAGLSIAGSLVADWKTRVASR